MPDRKGEIGWLAIGWALDPETPMSLRSTKIAAAYEFHKYVLHALENRLTPEKREEMENNLFSLLSDLEKQNLRNYHKAMKVHTY